VISSIFNRFAGGLTAEKARSGTAIAAHPTAATLKKSLREIALDISLLHSPASTDAR
jgi:hypothetical protein